MYRRDVEMNKKQLSDILSIIAEPMHGKDFYDRNSLKCLIYKIDELGNKFDISDETSQEQIIHILNNYIRDNVSFRKEYLDKFYEKSDVFDKRELIYRTAYAALTKGEAVCSGFTEAMRVLMAYYGIKSKTIIAKLPRRYHNPTCHYLSVAYLNNGSIKIVDPERESYCQRKGYDFAEYLERLEYAIPNKVCSDNKLINDGVGMFANDYLMRSEVKKAKGTKGIIEVINGKEELQIGD